MFSIKVFKAATSFKPGAVSKRLFRSMPMQPGTLNSRMRCSSPGPIPPLSRKGSRPLYRRSTLQSNC